MRQLLHRGTNVCFFADLARSRQAGKRVCQAAKGATGAFHFFDRHPQRPLVFLFDRTFDPARRKSTRRSFIYFSRDDEKNQSRSSAGG